MTTFLDFEASGLHNESYPIEVGWATINLSGLITSESYLILPELPWLHWSDESQKIHNIDRSLLAVEGAPVLAIAERMNEAFGESTVYCDGGNWDLFWCSRLFQAAGIARTFKIGSFRMELILAAAMLNEEDDLLAKELIAAKTLHRAGPDARQLAETYKFIEACRRDTN